MTYLFKPFINYKPPFVISFNTVQINTNLQKSRCRFVTHSDATLSLAVRRSASAFSVSARHGKSVVLYEQALKYSDI